MMVALGGRVQKGIYLVQGSLLLLVIQGVIRAATKSTSRSIENGWPWGNLRPTIVPTSFGHGASEVKLRRY